jgi:hypothetical protein
VSENQTLDVCGDERAGRKNQKLFELTLSSPSSLEVAVPRLLGLLALHNLIEQGNAEGRNRTHELLHVLVAHVGTTIIQCLYKAT